MSIEMPPADLTADATEPAGDGGAPDWLDLMSLLAKSQRKGAAKKRFGDAASGGSVYRWGVAASKGASIDDHWRYLAKLACDDSSKSTAVDRIDWESSAQRFIDQLTADPSPPSLISSQAVVWAAAMPALAHRLMPSCWWRLLTMLQQVHETTLQRDHPYEANHLILGGELGLTLSGRMSKLEHCKVLQKQSILAVRQWCSNEADSIADAIEGIKDARLVLASLIRCDRWLRSLDKSTKLRKKLNSVGESLVILVASTTRPNGTVAFSDASRPDVRDDLPPHGLLAYAGAINTDSLQPAIDAALGKSPKGGRLVWEVSLPESMHHHPDAGVAAMCCQWDVRRGKTVIDYAGEEVKLEIHAGKKRIISGSWQSQLEVDGIEQHSSGPWSEVCEFTDDDVHYLEIEQPWSGGVTLQRQVLLFRDDRAMMLADAVLPTDRGHSDLGRIQYASRLPLTSFTEVVGENETRELYLADKHRRVMLLPLAASEWKMGPSESSLRLSDDHHLVTSAIGTARLYCPLWLDFLPRRFKRKRTWRQLTVADQLRTVAANEAVAYRVQFGSEQWVVYRNLDAQRCRTFLGKHLLADFFCSRFDPSDGNHEELITVDDGRDDDE